MWARFRGMALLGRTLWGLLVVVCVAREARADARDPGADFDGPLGVLQLHPIRQSLLDVMNRGSVAHPWLRAERNVGNIWNSETHLSLGSGRRALHMVDGQQESLVLDAGIPVGRFLALGVRGGMSRMWGGGPVDQSIEDFHRQFDFYNFSRHHAPANRTSIILESDGKRLLTWHGNVAYLQNVVLTTYLRALENRTTRVMVRSDVRVPTGDISRALGLLRPEAAVGISVWRRFRRVLAFHLAGAAIWHGNRELAGLKVEEVQLDGEVSLELRLSPWLSLVAEDKLQSPLFQRTKTHVLAQDSLPLRATAWNGYFTPVNIITGGARLRLPDGTHLSVFVGEDFMFCTACWRERYSRETNSPDISLSLVVAKSLSVTTGGPP
ncbi:MAG: DUF3187 family protein [Myxococcota bacterium]